MVGGVPGIFDYFKPADGNPYVMTFYGSVFFVWILGTWWLFFRNGAEMLVDHPGLFNRDFQSTVTIKVVWLLMITGGIAAVSFLFSGYLSIPLDFLALV